MKGDPYVGETSISSNLGHCFRFSENGTVFVATTLLRASQSLRVLRALPEKMPCVTSATISEAPCSRRVSAALARVPQVSGGFTGQLRGKVVGDEEVSKEGLVYRPCRRLGSRICPLHFRLGSSVHNIVSALLIQDAVPLLAYLRDLVS